MPVQREFPLERPPIDAVGVQLMFDFTRTKIFEPIVVVAHHNAQITAAVDPAAPWLVTARWNVGESRFQELGGPTLLLSYSGEPLRHLGNVWLQVQQGKILNQVDPEAEITDWLACRARQSRGNPAQRFFLALDKATHPALMRSLSPAGRQRRQDMIKGLIALLTSRLGHRKNATTLVPPTDDTGHLNEVSRIVRRAITAAFKKDMSAAAGAFDRFAAGLLRQQCPVTHPQLVHRLRNACDADGAMVFLFAELALAVIQLADLPKASARSKAEARFWRPLLNALVRMQWIYVQRHIEHHKFDPKCFPAYGDSSLKPLAEPRMQQIVADYAVLDQAQILARVRDHATHVHSDPRCFT